jgi:hypothetical protein
LFEPFAAFGELFHKRHITEIPYFQGESDRADLGISTKNTARYNHYAICSYGILPSFGVVIKIGAACA